MSLPEPPTPYHRVPKLTPEKTPKKRGFSKIYNFKPEVDTMFLFLGRVQFVDVLSRSKLQNHIFEESKDINFRRKFKIP